MTKLDLRYLIVEVPHAKIGQLAMENNLLGGCAWQGGNTERKSFACARMPADAIDPSLLRNGAIVRPNEVRPMDIIECAYQRKYRLRVSTGFSKKRKLSSAIAIVMMAASANLTQDNWPPKSVQIFCAK